jgi:hypothetical protein
MAGASGHRPGPPGRSQGQLLQGQELGGVHVDQLRRSSTLAGEQLVGERRSDSIEPRLAWACTPSSAMPARRSWLERVWSS